MDHIAVIDIFYFSLLNRFEGIHVLGDLLVFNCNLCYFDRSSMHKDPGGSSKPEAEADASQRRHAPDSL